MAVLQAGVPEAQAATVQWVDVVVAAGVVLTLLSAILGVFFRLIKSNLSNMFELSIQQGQAAADKYEIKLEASVRSFETKLEVISTSFAKLIETNRATDHAENKRLTGVIEETRMRLEVLDKDYRKFLAHLPLDYVQRDDWIREFSKVDAKLDAIWNELTDNLKAKKSETRKTK